MKSLELTNADRAVYHFVEAGKCDAAHAALYKRELSHLSRAGLVKRLDNGDFAVVASTATPSTPPPAVQVEETEHMIGVSIRLPLSWVQALDAAGPVRSDTIRKILADALGEKFEPAPPVNRRSSHPPAVSPSGIIRRAS